MAIEIVNKILVVLFVFSCLTTARHIYYFIQAWVKSDNDDPEKYRMSKWSLIFIGLSIAYIISSIFIGITI